MLFISPGKAWTKGPWLISWSDRLRYLSYKIMTQRTSTVVQWLRSHLARQGTRVQFLVRDLRSPQATEQLSPHIPDLSATTRESVHHKEDPTCWNQDLSEPNSLINFLRKSCCHSPSTDSEDMAAECRLLWLWVVVSYPTGGLWGLAR